MKITAIHRKKFDGLTDQVEQEIDVSAFSYLKIELDNGMEVIIKPTWKDELTVRTLGCYLHAIPCDYSSIAIIGEPRP